MGCVTGLLLLPLNARPQAEVGQARGRMLGGRGGSAGAEAGSRLTPAESDSAIAGDASGLVPQLIHLSATRGPCVGGGPLQPPAEGRRHLLLGLFYRLPTQQGAHLSTERKRSPTWLPCRVCGGHWPDRAAELSAPGRGEQAHAGRKLRYIPAGDGFATIQQSGSRNVTSLLILQIKRNLLQAPVPLGSRKICPSLGHT